MGNFPGLEPDGSNGLPDVVQGDEAAQISVSISSLESTAETFDSSGRDLILHINYEFATERAMNFVVVDPVLFHTSAFVSVVDVATATAEEEFETVEGFHSQLFDKILSPEANKAVSEETVEKTMAPSQYAYQGLGVFTFPLRVGNKLRVTLKMEKPVPAMYERLHILTQETETETVTTRSKKKGLF